MSNEILALTGFLLVASLCMLFCIYRNSYGRRRKVGEIATRAMLDVVLDEDLSLYYSNLRFAGGGRRHTVDHLIFTENNIYAIKSIETIGQVKVLDDGSIVRILFGFIPVEMGNVRKELNDAVSVLSDHLKLTGREHGNITQLVVLSGSGLVFSCCPGDHVYLENLAPTMASIEGDSRTPAISPVRIVDAIMPVLGEGAGKVELSSVDKVRYDEAKRIASRACRSGFEASSFAPPMSSFGYLIKWFKDNY